MDSRPIAVIALDEPAIGYAASNKFRRSAHACPRCMGPLWIRIRFKSGAILGVTCEDCFWIHTYTPMVLSPPAADLQDLPGMFFEGPPDAPPHNGAVAP